MSILVISGAQTGVDRAALDAADDLGIKIGGYCPKGRIAEDGRIPDKYPMWEMKESDYKVRTIANVKHSTITVIINRGDMTGGTRFTYASCLKYDRQVVVSDLFAHNRGTEFKYGRHGTNARYLLNAKLNHFLFEEEPIINVAGPRESKMPGIYHDAYGLCLVFFTYLLNQRGGR